MDARSVMEQRLQAMVCCFSMVQRVLARQPQDDSTVVSTSTSTSGCTTQSESSKKPNTSTNTPHNTGCSMNILSNSSSSSSTESTKTAIPECEQGFEGKLPTRAVSAAEAAERIWKYLSAVPSLMEVSIFCDEFLQEYLSLVLVVHSLHSRSSWILMLYFLFFLFHVIGALFV